MLCLMEHMYHELGLVVELHINPITLRRWLVSQRKGGKRVGRGGKEGGWRGERGWVEGEKTVGGGRKESGWRGGGRIGEVGTDIKLLGVVSVHRYILK